MEHCLSLRNEPAELSRLSVWLEALKDPFSLSKRDLFRLDLALVEAVTNIIDHGLQGGPLGCEIAVRLNFGPDCITATVLDRGQAFDPVAQPEKMLPARLEDAEPGGLGIHLIRKFTDGCHYERVGETNRLTMIFKRSSDPASDRLPNHGRDAA